ncbi:hypothetical protein A3I18_01610 [Candidatus Campbellbacteria bacterium RIFCSPLOWO2_02_FULL_35_11]|uniref:Peptidase S11 D-alanyl-D-alanine carboxypeptidase A N-terminal domain-containing protein n=1 Tax=Candidatus Campbellbacteria bacterium RIFCSPLOWO2_02_FULL_35_11 TaxID=1797581 RepID=A0A1F5EQZ6_9BACT|nr:MAG: hypothetical protein A3I18_01610 [Candidatus Campbellbacteria bacterium RIFCSPLOWO2_02_FULL_35_11]
MKFFEEKKTIYIIVAVVLLVLIGAILFWNFNREKDPKTDERAGEIVIKKNYFEDISLEGESAFVWDVKQQKILFAKNPDAQLPLASLTKLMTALVSSELVPNGTIVTIKQDDLNIEGDSGLVEGESWTLKNVLDFTLMSSSNDGAHALASVIGYIKQKEEGKTEREMFIAEMNKRALEIGLSQTYYLSESGLDLSEGVSGAYGSAKDTALLMEYIIKNKYDLIESTRYSVLRINSKDVAHSVENTNHYVESIPGILGSKTGFTDLAGGNLVVAFDMGMGHPIIVSVLGSSKEGRFSDIQKLVNASINQIAEDRW